MHVSLLALLLLCFVSRADAGTRVAVAVAGEPTLQGPVMGQFQVWIQQHGYTIAVVDQPVINTISDCFVIEDAACSRSTFEARGNADHLVFVQAYLETGEQGRKITLTAHWFSRGRETITEKRTCERCEDAVLAKTVDELMSTLVKLGGQQPGRLTLSSKPAGLTVTLDGTSIGVTPLERAVQPGPHKIALVRDGKIVAERAIVIEPGKPADVAMMADSNTLPDGHERKRSRIVPGAVIGIGAAAIVTGGVLFAIGQDETGEHRTYRDTERLGVGVIAGGAAVVGAGVFIWLRGSKSDGAPMVSVDSTGARVGWARRF